MSATAILIVGVAVVIALPIAWRVSRRRFDPFEPIVFFALAWGVMFVVRPAAILIRDDTIFWGVDIGAKVGAAVVLGLVGAVAFVTGYELRLADRVARVLPSPPSGHQARFALPAAFVVAGLGVLALALLLLPTGGLDGVVTFLNGRSQALGELLQQSTTYLWWASLLVVPAALIGFALAFIDPRPATIVPALALIGLGLLRTVPVGNRIFLLSLIGGMVVFVYAHRGTRPRVVSICALLVVALFVSNVLMNFRYPESRDLGAVVEGLAAAPGDVLTPLTEGPDAEMAPALAGALLVVPNQLPYRYGGATVEDLLLRPIPRQLWAGKPEPPGQEVTAVVWPGPRKLGGFDPAFTPLLNFFWDFGLFGVVFGMSLYGIAARLLYQYFLHHAENLTAQLLFGSGACYLVVALRHDTTGVFVQGVVLFVPIVAVFAVSSWAAARKGRAEARRTLRPATGDGVAQRASRAG
jgi:hypothetical protein